MHSSADKPASPSAEIFWHLVPYPELSLDALYDVLELRQRVFIVEQNCPYIDADGIDPSCWHVIGRNEHAAVVAYARILPPGLKYAGPSIGRVVTHPKVRGTGLGRQLMREAIKFTDSLFPGESIRISAQMYLIRFYGGLGFEPVGDPYDEDGIPHVEMVRSGMPQESGIQPEN
jgi:ElaA protein